MLSIDFPVELFQLLCLHQLGTLYYFIFVFIIIIIIYYVDITHEFPQTCYTLDLTVLRLILYTSI